MTLPREPSAETVVDVTRVRSRSLGPTGRAGCTPESGSTQLGGTPGPAATSSELHRAGGRIDPTSKTLQGLHGGILPLVLFLPLSHRFFLCIRDPLRQVLQTRFMCLSRDDSIRQPQPEADKQHPGDRDVTREGSQAGECGDVISGLHPTTLPRRRARSSPRRNRFSRGRSPLRSTGAGSDREQGP